MRLKLYFWPHDKKPEWISKLKAIKQDDLWKLTVWAVGAWLFFLSLKFMWWAWIIALVVYLIRKK